MSEKHTQGKLAIGCGTDIVTFQNGRIMDVASVYCHVINGRAEANAQRIVACWNACDGIDTADLKAGSVNIIQKLHDEAAKLVLAQRDELLAALKAVDGSLRKAWSVGALPSSVITAHVAQHCKAAIAKVEGGA